MNEKVKVFKAIGDETRLKILILLWKIIQKNNFAFKIPS